VAWELGLNLKDAAESLSTFRGVGRRFEIKGEVNGATVVDDYGHHPTEISAVLDVARRLGRVIVVFQPHRYTRTRDLVYPAGEKEIPGVSSGLIYGRMRDMGYENVEMVGSLEEAAGRLKAIVREGDVVLLQGAGNVYRVWELLV